jgi:hypothetical protein
MKESLVDFLICGTQKGGTTALYSYLSEHPQICMAGQKEVHFFDSDNAFSSGRPPYEVYHASFKPRQGERLLGEATPIYMYWYQAAERIWKYNPNIKLIFILRSPIDRAYSHWNMERERGMETLSFWDALQTESERCRLALPKQHRVFSYTSRGFYLDQLRRFMSYFPREQLFILKHEDLRARPAEALGELCAFLEVDALSTPAPRDVHSRSYGEPMGKQEREYLRNLYEYEIRGLERLLGWDCSAWL